ncbi:DUF7503 family protein [Haladaptatus paucihalophilus]|uniref:Uncharacterized protein n=1 Tax=Haladaptatus paucihalophilus DX253 TaxID=797209 RepID=A0A1M6VAX8_HALPU|nr:hypothetical protein SAMN05444342_2172 [Haladaptatus paucihalophilus DX253]
MSEDNLQSYLAQHPRMIGVLFAICALLVQVGNVMAASGNASNGP